MRLYAIDRNLDFSFEHVALGVWNKYRVPVTLGKIKLPVGMQNNFSEIVMGLEEGPDGVQVVKAKVAHPKNNKPVEMSASLVRFDFPKRLIGHWERIASCEDRIHPEEREFIYFQDIGPQKTLYSKKIWYSSMLQKAKANWYDKLGFVRLKKAIQSEAKPGKAAE